MRFFPKGIKKDLLDIKRYVKVYGEEFFNLYRYIKYLTLLTTIIVLFYSIISIEKNSTKLSNTASIFIKFLEVLLIIMTGVLTSLIASFVLSILSSLYQQRTNEAKKLREDFSAFFNCYETSDHETGSEKVTVVLPFYVSDKYIDLGYGDVEEVIKKEISQLGKNGRLTRAIKIFRDLSSVSFAQSDVIAASKVIANFTKMGMITPTIRSDIQSLLNFFSFSSEDKKVSREEYLSKVKSILPDDYLEKIKIIFSEKEEDKNDITKGLLNMYDKTKRFYNTYFLIGLYSNLFVMDFFNDSEDNDIKRERHFIGTHAIVKDHVMRIIEIRTEANEDVFNQTFPLPLGEMKDRNDYALIARLNYAGKSFFIIAGITGVGTHAAALYLFNKWQIIQKNIGNKSFAIVIDIKNNQKDLKDIGSNKPRFQYPDNVITHLKTKN